MKRHQQCLLLGIVAALTGFVTSHSSYAETITFDTTTSTGWTATGGGAQTAEPFVVLAQESINGAPVSSYSFLTVTSTGGGDGTFLSGGSLANFTGFWKATYTFSLPREATNITLNYGNFFVDDRAVISLNGQTLNATGIYAGQGGGEMVFTDGGSTQSYSFSSPNGAVSGTTTTGFNVGGINTVEAVINDTGNGIYGSNRSNLPYPGNTTYLGLSGRVTYSVPPNVYDDFNGSTVNTNLWNVILPFSQSYVTEGGGYLTTGGRGTLATVNGFSPPIVISGVVTLNDVHEHFEVHFRTDLSTNTSPGLAPYFVPTGIMVAFNVDDGPGGQVSIQQIDSTDPNPVHLGITNFSLSVGTPYNFTITDDGTNIDLVIDGTHILSGSSTFSTGDKVAFQSREFSYTSSSLDYAAIIRNPGVVLSQDHNNFLVHFVGVLEESTNLASWADVPGQPSSPLIISKSGAPLKLFFRAYQKTTAASGTATKAVRHGSRVQP